MPSLAEAQRWIRDALVKGETASLLGALTGGGNPLARLEIHQRHYEASLVSGVVATFPATAWLVGTPFLTAAARVFVHECPPKAPCIAEYGDQFPDFLASRPEAARLPYLKAFAELEWTIGRASIAVDHPALETEALAAFPQNVLPDVILILQPGVWYVRADWPVDTLMTLYLSDSTPGQLAFEPAPTRLQVRGARGAFDVNRLEPGDFVFRKAIVDGECIGTAAERALEVAEEFDPGRALASLFAEELVTASRMPREEPRQ